MAQQAAYKSGPMLLPDPLTPLAAFLPIPQPQCLGIYCFLCLACAALGFSHQLSTCKYENEKKEKKSKENTARRKGGE